MYSWYIKSNFFIVHTTIYSMMNHLLCFYPSLKTIHFWCILNACKNEQIKQKLNNNLNYENSNDINGKDINKWSLQFTQSYYLLFKYLCYVKFMKKKCQSRCDLGIMNVLHIDCKLHNQFQNYYVPTIKAVIYFSHFSVSLYFDFVHCFVSSLCVCSFSL